MGGSKSPKRRSGPPSLFTKLWILPFILCASLAHGSPYALTVDWASPPTVSLLVPTLQVVPNAAAYRSSPIHDAVWSNLAALRAEMVRLQLWLPFPGMGVAALEPPSPPGKLCGFRAGGDPAFANFSLDCGPGSVITAVDFAIYGRHGGICGALEAGGCAAPGAAAAVAAACVGKQRCTVVGSDDFMGGAAPCAVPTTAVQVSCSGSVRVRTSWDFSRMDTMVEDFLSATAGAARTVVDFSTPPQWLYKTPGRVPFPDDPEGTTWAYEQGKELVDPSAVRRFPHRTLTARHAPSPHVPVATPFAYQAGANRRLLRARFGLVHGWRLC